MVFSWLIGVMPVKIDWEPIDKDLVAGMSTADASYKYAVKQETIQKHINRTKLAVPSQALMRNIERRLNKVGEKAVEAAVTNWLEKGEQHREAAFEIAHESVKMFTPRAPKSFRELEAADKVARRAAGLDTSDTTVQTLINVNERIESFDDEVIEVGEASATAS
jgi:hypothetical protein